MHYETIEKARQMQGLRIACLAEMPSPWSLAARAVFDFKGIEYVTAGQYLQDDKTELLDWSGQGSLPVVAYNDERLITTPEGIIWLAERLAPQPSLLPQDPMQRTIMFGLLREVVGENSFGWYRRLQAMGPESDSSSGLPHTYGYRQEQYEQAATRVAECLQLLDGVLASQPQGSQLLVGDSLTALDLYAAIFLGIMIQPVASELIPLPELFVTVYSQPDPVVDPAFSARLDDYRNYILQNYIQTPMQY